MPQFLSKHEISLQQPKAPTKVENLAGDLLGIMESSTQALNTYNVIGATAAKTQAQEDARAYHTYVSEIKASLADKEHDPESWTAARNAIQQLSAEYVAKADTFKNHSAAFDAYANYALDNTTEVQSAFEPFFYNGYANADVNKWTATTNDEARNSASTPSGESLKFAQEGGVLRNIPVDEVDKKYTAHNLNIIDTDIKSFDNSALFNKVTTDGVSDGVKVASLLNGYTGSMVKYIYNGETKKVSLVTQIQSPEVKEQYISRFNGLMDKFANKEDYHNVDHDVMVNNYKAPQVSTPESTIKEVSSNRKAFETFKTSQGFLLQTPAQQKVTADNIVTNENVARTLEAIVIQSSRGRKIDDAIYNPIESYNNNGVIDIRDAIDINGSLYSKEVNANDVDSYISAQSKEFKSRISYGQDIPEMEFQSLLLTRPELINSFAEHTAKNAAGLEDIKTEEEAFNRINALNRITNSQYGINKYDAEAMSYVSAEMESLRLGMETALKNTTDEKQKMKIRENSLNQMTKVYKTLPLSMSFGNSYKERDLAILNEDLIDIDGIWNNFPVDEQTANSARLAIIKSSPNKRNPSNKEVAEWMSAHAFNTDRWFSFDNTEKILFEVVDDNGYYIPQDIMAKGLKDWAEQKKMNLSDFEIINGAQTGRNTAIIIKDKTGQAVDRLSGRWFNINYSNEINKARKVQKQMKKETFVSRPIGL